LAVLETNTKTVTADNILEKEERKTTEQLTGQLLSNNIGIKSTLNPPKKEASEELEALPDQNEEYTEEDLKKYWNEYVYQLKVAKRDSLHSTLVNSDMKVDSNHLITLKIKNNVQSNELDAEKTKLIQFLRKNLKNTNISLQYEMEELEQVSILDSKATFEKLAEENTSLQKFRKLFNLDIDY
jgi:hypothetical protein